VGLLIGNLSSTSRGAGDKCHIEDGDGVDSRTEGFRPKRFHMVGCCQQQGSQSDSGYNARWRQQKKREERVAQVHIYIYETRRNAIVLGRFKVLLLHDPLLSYPLTLRISALGSPRENKWDLGAKLYRVASKPAQVLEIRFL